MEKNESFTSVLVVDVADRDFDRLSSEVTELLARRASSIPGLIECGLLGNEARTQLWLLSEWESRHAWARSRWDKDVGKTVTDLVQSAVTYRVEGLVPILVIRRRE